MPTPLSRRQLMRAAAGLLAVGTVSTLSGCVGGSAAPASGGSETTTLHLVGFAVPKEANNAIQKKFAETPEGKGVVWEESYGASGDQSRAVVNGLKADYVNFSLEGDVTRLVKAGLVADDWNSGPTKGIVSDSVVVIAVPKGNPGKVKSLADLAGATTVLCAPQVPCGSASATLLQNQGVEVKAASQEQNVTAVLQKVIAGEADAGLVYATDVAGEDAVESIVPAGAEQVVNSYPITALGEQPGAQDFVDFVLGPEGQQILKDHGFGSASAGADG